MISISSSENFFPHIKNLKFLTFDKHKNDKKLLLRLKCKYCIIKLLVKNTGIVNGSREYHFGYKKNNIRNDDSVASTLSHHCELQQY
jgi:hypothetical protein